MIPPIHTKRRFVLKIPKISVENVHSSTFKAHGSLKSGFSRNYEDS